MKSSKSRFRLFMDTHIARFNLCIAGIMALFCGVVAYFGYAAGNWCYTLDWILRNGLYLIGAVIAVGSAVLGQWHLSFTVLSGVHLGILIAEIFGPNPSGAEFGFGHYGWFIWIVVFLISVILGLVLQIRHRKRIKTNTK